VRINDRGPFVAGRIVDLSKAAASEIEAVVPGVVPVTLTVVTLGTNQRMRAADAEDLARASSTARPVWAVQAGAFGHEENALRLRDRLVVKYPKVWIEDFRGLKRVKFGAYGTREEADVACATLVELGLAGIVVPGG
jgi:rare lipoprotein A